MEQFTPRKRLDPLRIVLAFVFAPLLPAFALGALVGVFIALFTGKIATIPAFGTMVIYDGAAQIYCGMTLLLISVLLLRWRNKSITVGASICMGAVIACVTDLSFHLGTLYFQNRLNDAFSDSNALLARWQYIATAGAAVGALFWQIGFRPRSTTSRPMSSK